MEKKPSQPKRRSTKRSAATPAAATGGKPRRSKRADARMRSAKYAVGQVVRHRIYPFRGVIFDIDPVFANTEEWWQAIPEDIRPRKDQPYYHLLAENAETEYIAYVSEQNLLPDNTHEPLRHPQIGELFSDDGNGRYRARFLQSH